MNKLKVCCKCKLEKPVELFYVDNSRLSGRQTWCKKCHDEWIDVYRKKYEGKIRKYQKEYGAKWYLKNKERLKASFKKNYEANKEAYKIRNKKRYFRRFGITYEDAVKEWENNNKKCPICGDEVILLGGIMKKGFCVDHDHETGKFRGVLCHNCNAGIGMFQENLSIIKSAVKYLERFIDETQE